jgi:phosphopantetheinyl transferase (holo-ACP synthase)
MSKNKFDIKLQQNAVVDVYVAEIPSNVPLGEVYPLSRQEEIKAVKSEKVKREKYCAWKLLEYALYRSFGKRIEDVGFVKHATGKWTCDVCELSLSHSHNVVCVALSNAPVGVDVEKIEMPRGNIADKVLSEREKAEYSLLEGEQKNAFLIRVWAKKECLFKEKNIKALSFEEFKNQDGGVFEQTLTFADGEYALAVATNSPEKVRLYRKANWLKA